MTPCGQCRTKQEHLSLRPAAVQGVGHEGDPERASVPDPMPGLPPGEEHVRERERRVAERRRNARAPDADPGEESDVQDDVQAECTEAQYAQRHRPSLLEQHRP